MNTSTVLGKTLVFAGLSLAVILGICGLRSHWTTVKLAGKSASITELDQRARPFFEEAQRNVETNSGIETLVHEQVVGHG